MDATVEKQGCSHFSILMRGLIGSEDCLYNNIHTPKVRNSIQFVVENFLNDLPQPHFQLPEEGEPLKAVIVNIHPGGFFHGSGDPRQYGSPEYVIHNDIVYVCVSFRMHILGKFT